MTATIVKLTTTKKRVVRRAYRRSNQREPLVDQLGSIIQRSDYSYQWIAERAEVSAQTLYNWVNGYVDNPQLPKVARVLRVLGCKLLIEE